MNRRGFTLIGALITSMIIASLMLMIGRLIANGVEGAQYVQMSTEREAIRLMVLGRLSCQRSLGGSPCGVAGTLVNLKDKYGATVISQSGTLIGSYTLRAECGATPESIVVKAVRLRPGASIASVVSTDFIPLPMNKRVIDWSHPQANLYGVGIEICPDPTMNQSGKKYVGVTPLAYSGDLGGWEGAHQKCVDTFGFGAVMCATDHLETSMREGLIASMPEGDFWQGGSKDHWIGQHCRNWESSDGHDQGNTIKVEADRMKMHASALPCDHLRPIVCCQ